MGTAFGGFLLFEQIESDMAQDGEVFGRLVFAYPAVVFIKGHIQNPMEFVFDRPMFAHHMEYTFCIAGQAGDIKTHLAGLLASDYPCANHHGDVSQPKPVLYSTNEMQIFRI